MVKKTIKKAVKKPAAKKTAKKPAAKKTSAKKASSKTVSLKNMSTEQINKMITEKAYELYLERGCNHGDDHADWYRAESLVRSKFKK